MRTPLLRDRAASLAAMASELPRESRRRTSDSGQEGRGYVEENAAAVDVDLTIDDLVGIETELPSVAGERCDRGGNGSVDR